MNHKDQTGLGLQAREQYCPSGSHTSWGEWGTGRMHRKGFTLIELLVVIAIIAILAAIIFPVFSRVKDSAYRSSDLSNMNSIRTALQLYRQDQGGYPPALLGYVTQYSDGGPYPIQGDMVPANAVVGALFPKRIDNLEVFRPAYDRINAGQQYTMLSNGVWPNKVDGTHASNPNWYQKYGPTDGYVQRCIETGVISRGGGGSFSVPNNYYTISGYDIATVPNENGSGKRNEIHYSLFWSGWTVPTDPCAPDPATEKGNALDDPRQLGYFDPPEATVVTWDSNFRDYENLEVQHTKKDIVLFLGGSAKPYDSAFMAQESWKATP